MYFRGQNESEWDGRAGSPLFTRGWTLQEEALSHRFLGFLPRKTTLRANTKIYGESGDRSRIKGTDYLYLYASDPKHNFRRQWRTIVEDYPGRQLTNPDDKLPALSGLAHQHLQTEEDMYFAGIWLSLLLEQLCWYVVTSHGGEATKPAPAGRHHGPGHASMVP